MPLRLKWTLTSTTTPAGAQGRSSDGMLRRLPIMEHDTLAAGEACLPKGSGGLADLPP